jgi:hypothetical protein
MEDKTLKEIAFGSMITVLMLGALAAGINGVLLTATVGVLATMAGYTIGKKKE